MKIYAIIRKLENTYFQDTNLDSLKYNKQIAINGEDWCHFGLF